MSAPRSDRWFEIATFFLFAFIGTMQASYPTLPRQTDETNYIATAYKMERTWTLTSATHHPIDILRHGLEHKHVKMPAYLMLLAGWLELFPDPDSIRVLNELLFGGAMLGLWWFAFRDSRHSRGIIALGGLVLLSTPMGIAYSTTAMMESFVLAVAVLHFLAWFANRGRQRRLWLFYLTGFLAFVTKETLLFLSLGLVLSEPREFVAMHARLWNQSRARFAGLVAMVASLGTVAVFLFRDRGYHPSFRNRLAEAAGLGPKLHMVGNNLAENLGRFASWSVFPHDYFYAYALGCFAAAMALTIVGWRSAWRPRFLALAITWSITILFVCALYDNYHWRSHRIYSVWVVLTTTAAIGWVLGASFSPRARVAVLLPALLLNGYLAFQMNRYMITMRGPFIPKKHVLTTRGLANEGDCMLQDFGFHFLMENLHCELIWRVPQDDDSLRAVVERAKPRFAILPEGRDIASLGYRRIDRYYDSVVWIRAEDAGNQAPR